MSPLVYTLKSEGLSKFGLSSIRLFAKGLNLLTFTKYPGWDPEANFVGTGPYGSDFEPQTGL